jgi:hypothetical protein
MMEALSSSETSVLTRPHGVTSQKTPFFIVAAVKTSNLTRLNVLISLNTAIYILWSSWWDEVLKEKQKYLEKTCPNVTLYTTKLRSDVKSNMTVHD